MRDAKDNAFIQLLLLAENSHFAAERIYNAIVWDSKEKALLKPILRAYDLGSTRYVDFDTTRPVYTSRADKCHINYVVADTTSWEQKMAQALEDMDEVICYVKNQGLEFTIPYVIEGEEKKYYPDFIVRLKDKQGEILNLIVEVLARRRKKRSPRWLPPVICGCLPLIITAVSDTGLLSKYPIPGMPRILSGLFSKQGESMDKSFEYDEIGTWSEIKLDIVKQYAAAYTTILSKQISSRNISTSTPLPALVNMYLKQAEVYHRKSS